MVNSALPRPAGGLPGPFTYCPLPLAPSLRKNHPCGADGVTTNLHPAAAMTTPTARLIKTNLRMKTLPRGSGPASDGDCLHLDSLDGKRLHRQQRFRST